jgi:phage terminase large subunit-like protein
LTAILDVYTPDEVRDRLRRATPEHRKIIVPVLLTELKQREEDVKYDWRTCDRDACDGLPHEGMNRRHARPSQIPPIGDWLIWMLRAGRGFGKTRCGSETAKAWAGYNPNLPNVESMPGSRGAIVAPTFADARDTCIEGESGLLSVLPPSAVKTWNRSMGELILTNETRIKCFSAEEPERLRGPQFHWGWCDELAAWTRPEAWDQLMFGLRLGSQPKVVVTTTPKPTKLVRDLDSRETVHVTHGSTFENAANLAPAALDELRRRYEGTRLGEQELFAKILTDTPGALWTADVLSGSRVAEAARVNRRILAVDPADGDEKGDGYGVTVASLGEDGHGYIEINEEWHNSVDQMAAATIELAHDTGCGVIVVEKNHGGKWIPALLRKYDPKMKIDDVWAADGKTTRAEPISAFFANRDDFPATAHLVGYHPELEDQLTNYTGKPGEKSPDRLDSMVWALTYLMLSQRKERPKLVCV